MNLSKYQHIATRKLEEALKFLTEDKDLKLFRKEFLCNVKRETIVLGLILLITIISFFAARSWAIDKIDSRTEGFSEYIELEFLDTGDKIHITALRDAMNLYSPGDYHKNDTIISKIKQYNQEKFTNPDLKFGAEAVVLSIGKAFALIWEYVIFFILFVATLLLNYFLTKSLGVLKFVLMMEGKESFLSELYLFIKVSLKEKEFYRKKEFYSKLGILLVLNFARFVSYFVLFAPAYVIAYSIKTKVDTDTWLFMVILGVFSNGVLINYTNRFFTFLKNESREGYVETAIVKNLGKRFLLGNGGISLKQIFGLTKEFKGHVFSHIYMNAEFQLLKTVKEMASFLVTGLIIIEMALNIQGHLGYELLKAVYKSRYDKVIFIVFLLFLLVKFTEITVDTIFNIRMKKYENKS